jgi:hypothetical protein
MILKYVLYYEFCLISNVSWLTSSSELTGIGTICFGGEISLEIWFEKDSTVLSSYSSSPSSEPVRSIKRKIKKNKFCTERSFFKSLILESKKNKNLSINCWNPEGSTDRITTASKTIRNNLDRRDKNHDWMKTWHI